jgi:hypothetical protein
MPSLKQAGAIAASVTAIGTVAVALGFGWPWTTAAQGQDIVNSMKTFERHIGTDDETLHDLKRRDCERDRDDAQQELEQMPTSRAAKSNLQKAQDCIDTYSRIIAKDSAASP